MILVVGRGQPSFSWEMYIWGSHKCSVSVTFASKFIRRPCTILGVARGSAHCCLRKFWIIYFYREVNMHNFRPLLVFSWFIIGSYKGGIVLEEPQISVPFPSKLLEFGVARGQHPLAYRNFEFGKLNTHLRIQDFFFGGEGLKDIPVPTKYIKELTAPTPPPPIHFPLVCLGSLVSPKSTYFRLC